MARRKNDKPYDILGSPEPRKRTTSKPMEVIENRLVPNIGTPVTRQGNKPTGVLRTPLAAWIKAVTPMYVSEAKRLRGIATAKAKRDREKARTLHLAGEESRIVKPKPKKPKPKKSSMWGKRAKDPLLELMTLPSERTKRKREKT
jgi:hypothetical protein